MHALPDDGRGVVRRIIQHIRLEGLTVGDRLPSIRQLSEMWGVNPSVARDALLQAQTMGLVRIHPRSGAFVQSLDFSLLVDALSDTLETALLQEDVNTFHLVEARRLIEVEAVGEAARRCRPDDLLPLRQALEEMAACGEQRAVFIRADEKLHLGIARIAGNPVLVTILRACLALLRPYRSALVPSPDTRERTDRLHEAIYHCLRTGDAEGARAAMYAHLTDQRQRLVEHLDAGREPGPARAASERG